jgi:hypothetical protein
MYHAKDLNGGKIVSADDASPYGHYRCPTCQAKVFLRSGRLRSLHFAHMPKQGKPECELFHPSFPMGRGWGALPAPPIEPAVAAIELGIELSEATHSGSAKRPWALRLTLPRSSDGLGEMLVDLGGGDHRKVPLANLVLSSRTYTVDPAAPDFGVTWTSPAVSRSYRAAVLHRIPGLNRSAPSIFGLSQSKRKPRTEVVSWGDSYYLVYPNECAVTLPTSLTNQSFAENRGWACALVSLPEDPDPELADWFRTICDIVIAPTRRSWALVFPAPYGLDDDGALKVPPSPLLLLALRLIAGESAAAFSCRTAALAANINLSSQRLHSIEITAPASELICDQMDLAWADKLFAPVVPVPYPSEVQELAVTFDFQVGARRVTGVLHHVTGHTHLVHLRASKGQLSAIKGPTGLVGELRRRLQDWTKWEIEPLCFSHGTSTDGLSLIDEVQLGCINEALKDHNAEVVLDFWAFGRFACAPHERVSTQREAFSIDAALRQRIAWLLNTSGLLSLGSGLTVSTADDTSLVQAVTRMRPPPILTAHHRSIRAELRRYGVPA